MKEGDDAAAITSKNCESELLEKARGLSRAQMEGLVSVIIGENAEIDARGGGSLDLVVGRLGGFHLIPSIFLSEV